MESEAMNGAPLQLALPGGIVAEYVAESDPPAYTVNGAPIAVNVVIPDDLTREGWYWFGSFLRQPWPDRDDGPSVCISTSTYPPPGWSSDRPDIFTQARVLDAYRLSFQTELAARPAKQARKVKNVKQPAGAPTLHQELLPL